MWLVDSIAPQISVTCSMVKELFQPSDLFFVWVLNKVKVDLEAQDFLT